MKILTSLWGAQHPNAGRNIQHTVVTKCKGKQRNRKERKEKLTFPEMAFIQKQREMEIEWFPKLF